jgi:DNA-binding response OmpR family regulator
MVMNSPRVLFLTEESEAIRELVRELNRKGYACTVVNDPEDIAGSPPAEILMITLGDDYDPSLLSEITQRVKKDRSIQILLIAVKDALPDIAKDGLIDDFILKPYNVDELLTRLSRLVKKNLPRKEPEEYLKSGDITVDLSKCEVSVAGKIVDLTFTEYELLKLLMSKKGHVFTREALLNQVWGYDYFGGDRTVDVHITRLRSKIEDPSRSFIETVRNIGYRIKGN